MIANTFFLVLGALLGLTICDALRSIATPFIAAQNKKIAEEMADLNEREKSLESMKQRIASWELPCPECGHVMVKITQTDA